MSSVKKYVEDLKSGKIARKNDKKPLSQVEQYIKKHNVEKKQKHLMVDVLPPKKGKGKETFSWQEEQPTNAEEHS